MGAQPSVKMVKLTAFWNMKETIINDFVGKNVKKKERNQITNSSPCLSWAYTNTTFCRLDMATKICELVYKFQRFTI